MQAATDIFLGWAVGARGRHFYVRQLRDMKIKPLVEVFDTDTMMDPHFADGHWREHMREVENRQ